MHINPSDHDSHPSVLLQDHSSNSRQSSHRGSAHTSTGEEHPVNPVVSVSLSVEITKPVLYPNDSVFTDSPV